MFPSNDENIKVERGLSLEIMAADLGMVNAAVLLGLLACDSSGSSCCGIGKTVLGQSTQRPKMAEERLFAETTSIRPSTVIGQP